MSNQTRTRGSADTAQVNKTFWKGVRLTIAQYKKLQQLAYSRRANMSAVIRILIDEATVEVRGDRGN